MKRSIVDYLAENARRTPDATLVHFKERKISFREMEDAAARCRGALAALGIGPGDKVALVMSDGPEMMIAMLAVMVAMFVMPAKQPEMWASLACFAVIVLALVIKRGVRQGKSG